MIKACSFNFSALRPLTGVKRMKNKGENALFSYIATSSNHKLEGKSAKCGIWTKGEKMLCVDTVLKIGVDTGFSGVRPMEIKWLH